MAEENSGLVTKTVFTDVFVYRDGRWQAVNAQEVAFKVQSPSAEAGKSADEERVLATERAWCRTFVSGDVAALQRIELDDYTLTDSNGAITTKKDDLAEITGASIQYALFENRDMKVRIHGDTAIVTGRTVVQGAADGQPIDVEVQFTDTLVKLGGEWHGAASHVSRIRNGPAN